MLCLIKLVEICWCNVFTTHSKKTELPIREGYRKVNGLMGNVGGGYGLECFYAGYHYSRLLLLLL